MIRIPLTPISHHARGKLVGCSWCADGRLAVLEVETPPERINGMFTPTEVDKRSWYVTLYAPGLPPQVLPPIESKINFHYVQTLNDGQILLVCARCHYRNGEGERTLQFMTSTAGCCVALPSVMAFRTLSQQSATLCGSATLMKAFSATTAGRSRWVKTGW